MIRYKKEFKQFLVEMHNQGRSERGAAMISPGSIFL